LQSYIDFAVMTLKRTAVETFLAYQFFEVTQGHTSMYTVRLPIVGP